MFPKEGSYVEILRRLKACLALINLGENVICFKCCQKEAIGVEGKKFKDVIADKFLN